MNKIISKITCFLFGHKFGHYYAIPEICPRCGAGPKVKL